jgi:hypothetical protein
MLHVVQPRAQLELKLILALDLLQTNIGQPGVIVIKEKDLDTEAGQRYKLA